MIISKAGGNFYSGKICNRTTYIKAEIYKYKKLCFKYFLMILTKSIFTPYEEVDFTFIVKRLMIFLLIGEKRLQT